MCTCLKLASACVRALLDKNVGRIARIRNAFLMLPNDEVISLSPLPWELIDVFSGDPDPNPELNANTKPTPNPNTDQVADCIPSALAPQACVS